MIESAKFESTLGSLVCDPLRRTPIPNSAVEVDADNQQSPPPNLEYIIARQSDEVKALEKVNASPLFEA